MENTHLTNQKFRFSVQMSKIVNKNAFFRIMKSSNGQYVEFCKSAFFLNISHEYSARNIKYDIF